MRVRIIGAGIAGLSAAWAFRRAGCEVSILDRGPVPHPDAASFDHSRLIHPFPADTAAPARLQRWLGAWELVWRETGRRLHTACGVATLLSPGQGAAPMLERMAQAGIDAAPLAGEALARALPAVDLPEARTGLLDSRGGVLLAREIVATLEAHVRAKGGVIEPFRTFDPAELRDRQGADATILACGAWNRALLETLDPALSARLVPVRQVMLYLRPPAESAASWERMPAFVGLGDDDELWGVPPIAGAPLKLAVGAFAQAVDAPDPGRAPSDAEIGRILARFASAIRGVERYRLVGARACHYTRSDADDWIVARLPDAAGSCWLFGGCNGSGFKSAPAAALDLVETVLGATRSPPTGAA